MAVTSDAGGVCDAWLYDRIPTARMHWLPLALKSSGGLKVQESDALTIEEVQVRRATVGIKSAGSRGEVGGPRYDHTPRVWLEFPGFTVFRAQSESVNPLFKTPRSRILHLQGLLDRVVASCWPHVSQRV